MAKEPQDSEHTALAVIVQTNKQREKTDEAEKRKNFKEKSVEHVVGIDNALFKY